MFSNLFGKKSDHPLADIKSVMALLEELPRNDAHKMLMELTEWVESVGDNAEFKLEHQFAVLRLLDETAQSCVRKLVREYFAPQELSKFQENHLWLILLNWSHHVANAHFAVFERYCNGDKGAGALKAQLPLLAARTAHALNGYLKYVSAHYGPMDSSLWGKVARLYRHAEQQQYLDARVELYSGATTTVRCELAELLGWYGCGVGTLSPLSMHLTERIVGQYFGGVTVTAEQSSDSLFCFDLEHPAAPLRIKAGVRVQPSTRFVSMTAMQPKLDELLKELAKNTVPQELNLGGNYPVELVREAAQYLLDYLVDPPLRRSPRRGIKVSLKVVNGFGRLLEHTDVGLNFNAEQPLHWEVEDISASGFRTVIPAQADGIRIGSLLGIQPDGVAHWGAAVVRRLMRDNANRLHIGAEMLANQVAGVTLGSGRDEAQCALWLMAKSGEHAGEARLLMKVDAFLAQRSLQASIGDKKYLLMPVGLDEKGLDYDLARFRVIEQEVGED
ncbi:MAG: hypothetical protein A2061_01750 [Gallionellales bacterium GWA2_59_43]|nr:MAG: hypothetical protein A2061_01750 [Gallionellales bacterium GWA2_59_43]